MSQAVLVDNVLWAGRHGGSIFRGIAEDGAKYRFVAPVEVMPRSPVTGEVWSITGVLRRHTEHGSQVDVSRVVLQRPSGRLIVKALTESNAFPGIGAVTARKLWDEYGERIYELLDEGHPAVFAETIGEELAKVLLSGWEAINVEAGVYRWLDARGVSPGLAAKLMTIYGDEVITKLEGNPYLLLAFTSWSQADALGRAAGIVPDDPRRFVAAAESVVYQRLHAHHTWTPSEVFMELFSTQLALGTAAPNVQRALALAIQDRAVISLDEGFQGLGPYSMEAYVAERLATIAAGAFRGSAQTYCSKQNEERIAALISGFEASSQIALNQQQKAAVQLALTAPLACITGGAGAGKTSVLTAVCALSETVGAPFYCLALSGRAARRIQEATGRPAQTIASWIHSVDAGLTGVDCGPMIIVDESSMLDLATAYRLLRRLEPGCRLLLLGDPGQLPPIGFGLVFHTLVREPTVAQIELTEIMRQATSTGIPQVSLEVRDGRVPPLPAYQGLRNGVSFIECSRDEVVHTILDVVNDLGGVGQCRIVGSVKNGPAGVKTINAYFHQLLVSGKVLRHGYAIGEPVLWLRNDAELGLLNGSLGTIIQADDELVVEWEDQGRKVIDYTSLRDLDLAYAITTHKAQGSQFPRVVIPIYRSRLLDRTLLYTAITRAQLQVVIVGDRDAYEEAITNPPNPSLRQTAFRMHLQRQVELLK
jgi:exodeoxyribonuclease V alpha subunit